ncbi:MAG: filamentous hemagglutinin N-terminal domain-containing protein [Cyanobacteria bacterium P01_G01_bin.19]
MEKVLFFPLQFTLCTVGYLCASSGIAQAQVTSDGTVNTQVNQNGNVAEITGGETRGGNLFHSFQDFSVGTGNEAFFNNADSISNIFSRVTGGNISNIDGLIQANGSANLFLVNPAGILFGENARLDIGGSFFGTTANSLLFEDGEFSATNLDNPPLLTVNAPIGLSFRDNPGDIVNTSVGQNPNGETNITGGAVGLQVSEGETLAIVGGNVLLDDGNLTAKGGHIEIGSVTDGEVGITETDASFNLDYSTVDSFGDITLQNTAVVDATATGGGSIDVTAENLILDSSSLFSGIAPDSTSSDAQAGDIIINANELLSLDNGNIFNDVKPDAVGNAGNIFINTNSLSLENGSSLDTKTSGLGNAGNVFIEAQEITFSDSNLVTEVSSEGGVGDAGDINITTNSLLLQNGSAFLADTENIGNAGDISIEASNSVILEGEGRSQITSTVDDFESAIGNAGNIEINTDSLSVNDGGFIATSTFGKGNGGNININAQGTVSFDGRVGEDNIPSRLSTGVRSNGEGNGGNINIQAESLEITNRSQFSSNVRGIGDAGDINIETADEVRLVNSILISEVTQPDENSEGGRGDGGDINITTGSLLLRDGSALLSDTENLGDAGNINIEASERVVLEGEEPGAQSGSLEDGFIVPSQITATVDDFEGAIGDGGDINISTPSLTVKDDGFIRVSTFGPGNAGSLNINTDELLVKDDGSISASTFGLGNAGNLTINAKNLVLESGGELTAISFNDGNAGTLTINALESVTVSGTTSDGQSPSGIFASAFDGTGNGGNLTIATDELIVQDKGTIAVGNFQIVFGERMALPPGSGSPGTLNITANSLKLDNEGRIDAATQSETGDGANINLQVADNITLRNNSFISAQAFGNANGGNLTIDTNFIIAFPNEIAGNGSDIIASAVDGNGGNINITAESLIGIQEGMAIEGNQTNDIDASSEFSLDGTVNINTPDINPVQGVTELPTDVVAPEQTTQQACEANREVAAKNSLTINGKGGIIPEPGQPLNSLNVYVNGESTSAKVIPPAIETTQGKIQPARGVQLTESGEVILTAYRTNNAGERISEGSRNCSQV